MRAFERRVVVTGIGLVTPVGIGTEATWTALMAGKSGIGPITRFDATDYPARIAGEVADFDPEQFIERRDAKKMDRFIQFAVAAANMATADAGILPLADPERVGVLVGVGLGGLETLEEGFEVVTTRGPRRVSPFTIPKLIGNMAPGHISMITGARGPNLSSVSACATGAHSIGDAARLIAMDDADVMIAGGAEATITRLGIAGFAAMKALSTRNDEPERASRPFDLGRDGFVSAEGAGVVVLEELEHARARGAHIYCEILGYGQSSDAFHMTRPSPEGEGAQGAMRNALRDAGLPPEAVAYINAHGTSTPYGDQIEILAIRRVFGEHAEKLMVSSTKSMTGHMLGAAGAVELAVCALAVDRGQVPPTINVDEPDPECDLDLVPHEGRAVPVPVALSNSFGFGGTNVSLIVGKCL
ncbi:MAG: beta-ketoacyl-ACP synthase II [Myxococcales bacterium]|nr:beta-ketoacyl-ACP synthase II [Myxococcales bacterium]MCB9549830.1 beta-ketoacyl-ACP synthase II [Myxococcales bacterium]